MVPWERCFMEDTHMFARGTTLLLAGLLGLGMFFGGADTAKADDINRMYHYPYYYFPHSYAPNYQRWPIQGQHFAPSPAWMAYPPYLDQNFSYPLFENKRYYRGNHFFLDQF